LCCRGIVAVPCGFHVMAFCAPLDLGSGNSAMHAQPSPRRQSGMCAWQTGIVLDRGRKILAASARGRSARAWQNRIRRLPLPQPGRQGRMTNRLASARVGAAGCCFALTIRLMMSVPLVHRARPPSARFSCLTTPRLTAIAPATSDRSAPPSSPEAVPRCE